jgi:HEAT repeat protein
MNARATFLTACIISIALVPAFAADAQVQQAIQTILEKAPAADPAATQANAAQLVQLGGDAVKAMCGMLAEPGAGSDGKVRYALDGLAVYVSRPGAEAERTMFVKAVADALPAAQGNDVKQFLIERLQRAGKAESVDAVAAFLADERLCEPAARALQAIAADNARAAIAAALADAKGNNRVTLVAALGNLNCSSSVPAILADARSADTNLRRAALHALAQIGDPSAQAVLARAAEAKGSYERAYATSCYLLYAGRLVEQGKTAECAKVCRGLMEAGETHVQCAALSTLTTALGEDALGDLLAAIDAGDPELTAAALALAQNLGGPSATQAWIKKAVASPAPAKAAIISMLAARGDKAALDAIIAAFSDADQDVRAAALPAAVKLGGDAVIVPVMQFIQTAESEVEVRFAAEAINRLKGDAVVEALAKALPQSNQRAQIALIEALAARQARAHCGLVMAALDSGDAAVHVAAAKALADVASPADIDALIQRLGAATDESDKAALQKALVAAALRIEDEQASADKIVAALAAAADTQKIPLIGVLGRIGSAAALKAVVAEAENKDAAVNDAAVRALAAWPDAEAVSPLLAAIEMTDNVTHRVLALRGVVRLLGASDMSPAEAAGIYARALRATDRPDEKKLVIGGLGAIRTLDALRLVVEYLDDADLKTEAAMAAARIALGSDDRAEPLTGHEVVIALRRALPSISDEKTRDRMNKLIERIPPAKDVVVRPAPEGFVALFNGEDLTGWKGLLAGPNDNPAKRAALDPAKLKEFQARADDTMRAHWAVDKGVLHFDGRGFSLATAKNYTDFEMLVDWRVVEPRGDSGIYLRGSPQVQIWDPQQHGVGSGGLYNNKQNPDKPLVTADNPIGTWNTFRIRMIGDKVTVYLNGLLVVDNVVLENYWDRSIPIFDSEQIELQCHGNPIDFANIFIREIPRPDEFRALFNGRDLAGWIGDTAGYIVEDGKIVCKPGGNLYTEEQFDNFHLKFEFKLTPGANNGLGIRTPPAGDAAYVGMELQILDDTAKIYENLQPYQYHGSIYGVAPTKRGYLKPVGEWNSQEVIADGTKIKVILNGETTVDADIQPAIDSGTMDHREHPGLGRKIGHIGFLGHGSVVEFRNIQIRSL